MATVLTQSYMLLSEEKKESEDVTQLSRAALRNGKTLSCNGTAMNNGRHKVIPETPVSNQSTEPHRLTSTEDDNHTKLTHSPITEVPSEVQDTPVSETSEKVETEIPIRYKWDNIIAVFIVHTLAIYGLGYMISHFSYKTVLFSVLTGAMSGFGVTGGAHRYWTHRAYKANTPLQLILLLCYTVAGQNTLFEWVRDHRVHHKYSETEADPHNSNRGFFFSHVGWLLTKKHPEVIAKGNKIDMSDITSDPLLEWHRRNFVWLRALICFLLPTVIPMYFWNETFKYAFFSNILRYTLSLNATWSVNSFAHIWGYKPYDKRIQPVENIGVAIFSMGEGWHNYHHAFPWDYRASEMGYRFNNTAFLIDQFAKIGWAYDLKRPSEMLIAKMAEKYGEVPRINEWQTVDHNDKKNS